ncbi:hypothetical protein ACFQY0_12810 [Haloferula chungangensis]|uniref:O-antigen ligase domain-containing protein n=1 Tax=Haloferula chungangensis TaxID=1048331 RepID=A0ABW2L9F5_9BACT
MVFRIIQVVMVALVGVVMMSAILTGGGNVIGQTALYGMIVVFFVGLMSPKGGVLLMIILAGYSDMLKRLMVLETNISMFDLTYVLGMAPMALAGTVVACVVQKIFSGKIEKRDVVTFGVATVFLVIGAALGLKSGGGMRALRLVADYGAFSYLIFVLPILYPTRDEILKLVKTTILIFVPVALYGIWQRTFGLADFEHAYLLTGLSSESRQLLDLEVRPFSTLNAATSLTMVTASAVILILCLRRERKISPLLSFTLVVVFAMSCFMTFTRVGWAVLFASLCLIPVLRYKSTTFLMYVGGIGSFILVVLNADLIIDNLPHWQNKLYGKTEVSAGEGQGLRIMTLSDRFIGFENMKRPENWTPFGIKEEGARIYGLSDRYSTTFSHDAISGFLFKFGYVPLACGILMGLFFLASLHRAIFKLPFDQQRFCQLALAGIFGMLCSLATGGTVFQFPANIFFWFLFAMVLITIGEKPRPVEEGGKEEKEAVFGRLKPAGAFRP